MGKGDILLFYSGVQDHAFSLGLPRGRRLDSSPRRSAVVRCQDSSPNGVPRSMLLRKAESSASLCGWLTQSIQSSPRGAGPRCNGTPPASPAKALSEHHRHCSARRTSRARNALALHVPQHHEEVLERGKRRGKRDRSN